ncbi:sigma-54 dependent transcriptional regulator [Desulfobacula sp.]|uniref:sigma-54-dependent transcriptional regulator n=1 Tax=Desulfobacula sp. TaxID=2593537 RepID=UPI0026328B83|nr:sigma-54 dependent transcriptional regulator [Desulfobacula sp.]
MPITRKITTRPAMPVKFKLLFVDDEKILCSLFCDIMENEPLEIKIALNGLEAMDMLKIFPADIVITDMRMPKMNGMALLKKIQQLYPDIFVIAITGYGSVKDAVKVIKAGAYDYILKPFDFKAIKLLIEKIASHKKILKKNNFEKKDQRRNYRFENIIGRDAGMYEIFRKIEDVATTNATVLITGETGVGKELIAQALHYCSPRKTAPFLDLNCGAISESLVGSELFGHEKGAFTGAVSMKKGYFEASDKGTLFLDEIGDIPLPVQVSLLRLLEVGSFQRMGGTRTINVDVRIICATNKPLEELVKEKLFREDLFYRINVVPIHIPPLRERKSDIPLLANHFLEQYSTKTKKDISGFSKSAIKMLIRYEWPGNVRELTNIIENTVIFCKGRQITPDDLPEKLKGSSQTKMLDLKLSSRSLPHAEATMIHKVLEETDWNLKQTAELLSIARGTLYSKIKKYELTKPE